MDLVAGSGPAPDGDGVLLPIGEAAARLGVAPGTVRSWGRRYGLVPAGRSPGGHRRYTAADMQRLRRMQDLVDAGETPARAAAAALAGSAGPPAGPPAGPRRRPADRPPATSATSDMPATSGGSATSSTSVTSTTPGGPGGAVLAVPGGSPQARGLARAASRLDARAVGGVLGDLLIARGTVATWEDVLRPVLVAAGERWARTGAGIDVEHVLSEATVEALRAHRALQTVALAGPPVLLACAPEDDHVLPLHVVAAALAERHVPTQVLGARVPRDVVAGAARRLGSRGVLVWRQVRSDAAHDLDALAAARSQVLVVAGGPGWEGRRLPPGTFHPASLRETVDRFAAITTPRH